ncbi:hypothetical protein K490DRAFT_61124 [Saccharata proteae CBS 121410]|uniref:Uncharacterized protein n=1 Tax=Saccharata proteae CBS 121410 TaxID=1314787 RepID=A0A9P4LZR4_9PEZI|nr:hypothetical protein K490DRAFT_61124 [Saccharata proteae CBS 121410]
MDTFTNAFESLAVADGREDIDANNKEKAEATATGATRPHRKIMEKEPKGGDETYGETTEEEPQGATTFPLYSRLPKEIREMILLMALGPCSLRRSTASAISNMPPDPKCRFETVKRSLNMIENGHQAMKGHNRRYMSYADKLKYTKMRSLYAVNRMFRQDMVDVEKIWLKETFPMDLIDFYHFIKNPSPKTTGIVIVPITQNVGANQGGLCVIVGKELRDWTVPFMADLKAGKVLSNSIWRELMRSLPRSVTRVHMIYAAKPEVVVSDTTVIAQLSLYLRVVRKDVHVSASYIRPGDCSEDTVSWL